MKQKSLKLNFIMNIILTMSNILFPLITFRYASRILMPVGMGKVSLATSVVSYFIMFAQLGIPTYGIRACAKVRNNKFQLTRTVHELLFINIIMCAISYIAFAGMLVFIPRFREERILYIVVGLKILFDSIGMEWMYKGLEQYTYITVRSILFKLAALVLLFMLIHQQEDYVIYGGITIFAASASNILNFIHSRKYIDIKYVGNYQIKQHLSNVAIFFAMACATTVYTHMDAIMLGFISGNEYVGYYDAAVKIKTILVSFVTALGVVVLPRVSYYVEQGKKKEFRRITQKALNFVILLAIPLVVYCIIYAPQVIYFLSGPAYKQSIAPMRIIMPTLLFIGITNILGIQILVPLGKERTVLYSSIAGAIVNLVINSLLIPRFAATGAAAGTLIAEAVVLIVQYCALKGEVFRDFKQINYLKILGSLTMASVASLVAMILNLESFFTLAVSAIIFFSVYCGFLLITKEKLVVELFEQIVYSINKKIKGE